MRKHSKGYRTVFDEIAGKLDSGEYTWGGVLTALATYLIIQSRMAKDNGHLELGEAYWKLVKKLEVPAGWSRRHLYEYLWLQG